MGKILFLEDPLEGKHRHAFKKQKVWKVSTSNPKVTVVAAQLLSRVQLFAAPWTAALQAALSMGFPRQEYWSGVPFLTPGDFPHPGMKALSPALPGRFFTTEPPGEPCLIQILATEVYFPRLSYH